MTSSIRSTSCTQLTQETCLSSDEDFESPRRVNWTNQFLQEFTKYHPKPSVKWEIFYWAKIAGQLETILDRELPAIEYERIREEESNKDVVREEDLVNGRKEANKTKNRYGNILPYEQTRVKLKKSSKKKRLARTKSDESLKASEVLETTILETCNLNSSPISDEKRKSQEELSGAEEEDNDYINASYISIDQHLYIAAQAPTPHSFGDFWLMVFEQGSRTIVMLTREYEGKRRKSHRYWPEDGSEQYGDIEVSLLNEEACDGFIVREFMVTYVGDQTPTDSGNQLSINQGQMGDRKCPELGSSPSPRLRSLSTSVTKGNLVASGGGSGVVVVRQYHYMAWPDHGVPPDSKTLLDIIHNIEASARNKNLMNRKRSLALSDPISVGLYDTCGPMVVHCSAGIGRTGTFMIIRDTMSKMHELLRNQLSGLDPSLAEADIGMSAIPLPDLQPNEPTSATQNPLSLLPLLRWLRQQRYGMVTQKQQFIFCYEALLDEVRATLLRLCSHVSKDLADFIDGMME